MTLPQSNLGLFVNNIETPVLEELVGYANYRAWKLQNLGDDKPLPTVDIDSSNALDASSYFLAFSSCIPFERCL
ncbi:MAG: hypothetical protein R3261_14780 [Alphaproteobacteria bacterium]|nr:hypothetical protein [Alphaproteobacteria bacterium]